MNAKQVWAIIFIVLGVTFVIKGFVGYSAASFYGDEIESMNLLMKKHFGAFENEFFNIKHSRNVIRDTKGAQIVLIAIGILSSVIGTVMLKKKAQQEIENDSDYIDELPPTNDKWRM